MAVPSTLDHAFHRGRVRYLIPRLVLVLLGVVLVSTLFTMAMRWLASV